MDGESRMSTSVLTALSFRMMMKETGIQSCGREHIIGLKVQVYMEIISITMKAALKTIL